MSLKGICCLALALSSAVAAGAIEERFTLSASGDPGEGHRRIGSWTLDGAVTRRGFKGMQDFAIAHAAYAPDASVDLLLHLDRSANRDDTGNWTVETGAGFSIDTDRAMLGDGAASFRGPASAMSLMPGARSFFASGSRFRDFSLELWLYPASAENGEVILLWQSLRKLPGGVLPQGISGVVAGGRLLWSFVNLFSPAKAAKPSEAETRLELRARTPLVPRTWSHHLLRFDGDTGLLEYLVDGVPEAIVYATATGREGGEVREPAIGAAAPLKIGPEYAGLVDELRLCARFVDKPSVKPYGAASAVVVSPIADLGFGNSRILAIDAGMKAPGTSSIEFAYRVSDTWSAWRDSSPPWIPFRPGEPLPESARGRYAQVRAELYPDGTGKISPALSSLTIRYVADPPPPPPARLSAVPKDGAVELRWTRVPEADIGGYLVYYGDAPGEYFGAGADQGPSPIDAGNTTTMTITGVPNGKLLYFAVAAYDAAAGLVAGGADYGGSGGGAASRAGEFSPESAARPSRTAR